MASNYTEKHIRSLDWKEHIRQRPGMYIGKLGDGSAHDDGIYILLKEVIDNSIDEFVMDYGKVIEITLNESSLSVRDYGRGIPLGKVMDCASKINTGAKYDSEAFKKSVGLNGVGIKAVNALSSHFFIQAVREDKTKIIEFARGVVKKDPPITKSPLPTGTFISFTPDHTIFGKFRWLTDHIENMLWNYAYLNTGLTLVFNGKQFKSTRGLYDLLNKNLSGEILYPIVHLKGDDIEVAFTHGSQYGEEYYSFTNGQHTTQGGTHLAAFREAIVKTVREFYKKEYEAVDIRASILAAISVKIMEPVFESQTKTKLGSQNMGPGLPTIRQYIGDFIAKEVDDYLHKNPATAKALQDKILQSERERKELAGIKELARDRAKKANLCNRKLRDCRVHLDDARDKRRLESTLFITEGDSASGSITKVRDVETQAVFSLKGKPLNAYGLTKKIVYENEEFNLLQSALNVENGLEELRYNQVILATDADVDGMHIRLLLITFFLQFFPELVKNGHLYILQTPLFRVRNKKETIYCYSDNERVAAIEKLKPNPEITRFKGLGEISPDEFRQFIDKNMRLEPIMIGKDATIEQTLAFYMGKNTPDRQDFIVSNLRLLTD
jgi:topoisomerase-4 subunit B